MLALLFRVAAWILAVLYSIGLPIRVDRKDRTITAHSGCMELAANSVEAMQAGVCAGAQIVEFDLHFTGDGDPVLSHDAPEAEREYVSLSDAFRFLSENKTIRANVDVKSTAYLEKLLPLAEAFGVTEQLFMTGLTEDRIHDAIEKCPGIPYYLNTGVNKGDDFSALAGKAASLGAVGINIYWESASPALIKACHKAGLLVSVWTVNDADQILRLALMGADNITTLRPDLACALIR